VIGKTVSHYRILEKLGEGGMGVVYKAEDTKLKRTVALKFLPPGSTRDPDAKERFVREAQAASALEHPNICNIHEIDETEDGRLFIAMACYEGESLQEKIARGSLKLDEALDIATQVALGLTKAHENGIVHRDIKPANILMTDDGRAQIVDFGLAKLAHEPGLTRMGSTTGTIAYMSPEQTRGEDVDHRTDIWSLGVVLYEMVTGRRPFRGDREHAIMYSVVNEEPEPLTALRSGVPKELERIVGKAMAKRRGERYQHVDDMLVDLRTLAKALDDKTRVAPARPVEGEPPGPGDESLARRGASHPGEEIGRPGLLKMLLIPAVIVVAAILGFFVLRPRFFEGVPVGDPTPVIVISFENQTGDPTYDYLREAIPNLLITNLERSRYLRVTTWERLHDLLKQLAEEDVEFIDRELGFELCRMEGVDAIVLGSFTKAGETFATDVKVLDVSTKSLLGSANSKGEGVASILQSQIDELSRGISRNVGIPERAVEADRPLVADVTTSSMDAYNLFLQGRAYYDKLYWEKARQSLERAVEIDPTFAAAYLYLGWTHWELGNVDLRKEAFETARQLAGRATERERLLIEGSYALIVEREKGEALRVLLLARDRFPRDKLVNEMLGWAYGWYGQYDEAIAVWNRYLELVPNDGEILNRLAYAYAAVGDLGRALECAERYASILPGDVNPIDTMAEMYFRMGRLDDALAGYERVHSIKPDFLSAPWALAYICALREDYVKATEWVDRYALISAPAGGTSAAIGLHGRAFLHSWLGDSDSALSELETARTIAVEVGNTYWADEAGRAGAWVHYYLGDPEIGRAFWESWAVASDEPSYPAPEWGFLRSVAFFEIERSFYLGLIDVRQGRLEPARSRLSEIESRLAHGGARYKNWVPLLRDALRAEILVAEGHFDEAIEVCKEAPLPDAPPLLVRQTVPYNFLFRRDTLARAYARSGDLDKAIAEYERLLTFDPESGDRRLTHPTCRYELAKLYEEKGLSEKAVAEYERFLEIWASADDDRPEVVDARARLAALTGGSA
jgi:tetratricopeptide (TPR) repeat protein/predicted Ser/Thr protein kinase